MLVAGLGAFILLLTICIMPAVVQGAAQQLTIRASIASTLSVSVVASSLTTWSLDAGLSPYTQMLDKNNGVMVKANKAGWTLYVKSEVSTLADWDGSTYGSKALPFPLTLKSYPEGNAIGKQIEVSNGNQELVTNGEKGGAKKVGLGFTQPVSYEDEPLPSGHIYHTILTFTASATFA
jgi:hypothetical protein